MKLEPGKTLVTERGIMLSDNALVPWPDDMRLASYQQMEELRERIEKLEDGLTQLQQPTLTGSIQGLPGTVTVASYEGGWDHVGDGVFVKEEHGKPVPAGD